MPTKVSKNAREDELVRKGTKVLEVAVILIVGLIAVGLVFPSVLTLALEIALGIAVSIDSEVNKILNEARSDTLIRVKHELEAIADIGHEQPHVLPAFKADAGKKWLGFTKDDWDKFWKENKEAD